MALNQSVKFDEAATFRGLLGTITHLSQTAEMRGDRTSAVILLNVASLLVEVQLTQGLTGATKALSRDADASDHHVLTAI